MVPITDDFDLLHDVAPGKHFYQFYKSKEDLIKVLIPYWQAGIDKGHFCFWVIPDFMTVRHAREIVTSQLRNFHEHAVAGGFEIVPHVVWYGDGNSFDGDLVLEKYQKKVAEALQKGFKVIRAAGDGGGFKPHLWSKLREYEHKGQSIIHQFPCIGLCSYPIHQLGLQETKDVLENHHAVLVAKV